MAFLDALLGGLKGVANSSTPLPPEPTVNFTGSGVTVTDDPTNGQTTVTIPGGAASARIYVLPQTYGAVGNGSTDDSGAFNTMIAANAGKDILVGDGTFHLANNVSFNANQNIFFQNGAVLNIDSGKTLAMGKVNANLTQQIFSGSGSVTLPTNTVASPMWWGAKGDGVTDDAPAMQSAIASGGNIHLPRGSYKLNSNTTFTSGFGVVFDSGAVLKQGSSSVLINIAPYIDAPNQKIFDVGTTTCTGGTLSAGVAVGMPNAGAIYAAWWGAKADNTNDDTLPVQAALCAAANLSTSFSSTLGSSAGRPTVRLLPGTHKITSSLEMAGGTGIVGVNRASIISDGTNTIHLFRIDPNGTIIEGVTFSEGKAGIIEFGASAIYGGNLGTAASATGVCHIHNCQFLNNNAPSWLQDTSVPAFNRTASEQLIFTNCVFSGPSFYWASHDSTTFRDCTLDYDPNVASLSDTSGVPLAAFNNGAILEVSNIEAVPTTFSGRGCWMQIAGAGSLYCNTYRFGGEASAVIVRTRDTTLQWSSYPLPADSGQANIHIYNSPLFSTDAVNLMEFYGQMPATITLVGPPAAPTGTALQPAVIGGNNRGFFVDSASISLANLEEIGSGQSYKFLGLNNISAVRWRYGTDYSSTSGTDITKYLRNVIFADTRLPLLPTTSPQNNLMLTGVFDVSQTTGGDLTGFTSTGTDTSTGYSLTTYTAGSDGSIFAWSTQSSGFTSGWGGSNASAGEYTLSWYMKSSVSGSMIVTQNGIHKTIIPFVSSSNYVRYSHTFFHDGSTNQAVRPTIFSIASGAVISAGLFAIHEGKDACPYTYPIDSLSLPTTNTSTQDKIQGSYWATASPSGGTYKAGDIVWNSSPSAGSPAGWICKVAGTPGTFEPFGTNHQDHWIADSYFQVGSTPANSGLIRASNNSTLLAARNAANSADLSVIQVDSSNEIIIGDTTNTSYSFLEGSTGARIRAGGGVFFDVSSNTATFGQTNSAIFQDSTNSTALTFDISSSGTVSLHAAATVTTFNFEHNGVNSASKAASSNVIAQNNSGSGDGGDATISSGTSGSGNLGSVRMQLGNSAYLEATQLSTGNHVVALLNGGNINTTALPTNTGDKVIFIANATTTPTANSVGGGILYCDAGALKYRGTSGTVTTLGVA